MSENLEAWRADFAKNAGIESPVPEAPAVPAETADTPVDDGQARDEAGRFAAKDIPSEVEAVVEDVEEPAADVEPAEDATVVDPDAEAYAIYLAKYGNDPEKLSKAGFEASKIIGRQGAEVHEARQIQAELAEMKALIEAQQPAQAPPAYTSDDIQQFLDENPAMAPQLAQRAKEIGDTALYQRAMGAWAEVDTPGAMDYAARIAAWESGNQIREEFAPILSAAQEQQQARAVTQAVEHTAAKHQDFAEVIDAVTPEVLASLHPAILENLRNGDAESKASALETLYYAARGVQSERAPQAQAAAQAATSETARQARTDAAVGSANSASPAPRESSSNVEAWREDFRNTPEFRKAAGLT